MAGADIVGKNRHTRRDGRREIGGERGVGGWGRPQRQPAGVINNQLLPVGDIQRLEPPGHLVPVHHQPRAVEGVLLGANRHRHVVGPHGLSLGIDIILREKAECIVVKLDVARVHRHGGILPSLLLDRRINPHDDVVVEGSVARRLDGDAGHRVAIGAGGDAEDAVVGFDVHDLPIGEKELDHRARYAHGAVRLVVVKIGLELVGAFSRVAVVLGDPYPLAGANEDVLVLGAGGDIGGLGRTGSARIGNMRLKSEAQHETGGDSQKRQDDGKKSPHTVRDRRSHLTAPVRHRAS